MATVTPAVSVCSWAGLASTLTVSVVAPIWIAMSARAVPPAFTMTPLTVKSLKPGIVTVTV